MAVLGRILEIDLSAGRWKFLPYPDDLLWKYLSGRGFNVQYLYNHISSDADPLGPENILLLSCGLLTGTAAPASARLHINARSPLTGLLGSSNVGGNFGAKLRACGIQSLIIRGKSPEPVYIWLDGDRIEIRTARSVWGLDTWETDDYLKNKLGSDKLEIMTIGPAAENGVSYSSIMIDGHYTAGHADDGHRYLSAAGRVRFWPGCGHGALTGRIWCPYCRRNHAICRCTGSVSCTGRRNDQGEYG